MGIFLEISLNTSSSNPKVVIKANYNVLSFLKLRQCYVGLSWNSIWNVISYFALLRLKSLFKQN